MSWSKVRLGDIADFSNGVNFNKAAYSEGIKLISVSNFGNHFYPNYKELSEIKEDAVRKGDYLVDGDIVFVRSNGNKDLVGRCMLIRNPAFPVTFSGFCIRVRLREQHKYDPVFFTYHFKESGFRRAMAGTAVGANIQNLSQGRLNKYVLSVPDYKMQIRIADTLSKYDSLIENNQKQIELLEEAAQRLYKEWFVDLRFPGYEHKRIVDGIPEGWQKTKVGALLGHVKRCTQIKTCDYQPSGKIPVIDQSRDFIAGFTDDETALIDLNSAVILFGDHTRILKYILFPFAKGADGTQIIISNNESMPQSLFYWSLKCINLSNYHYARHFKYLKEENILLPQKDIALKFASYVDPIMQKIQSSREVISNASAARDLILPKLMNGEIEL